MADFLGLEPWAPLEDLLPLYYGDLFSNSDGSCESCESDCSVCNGSRNLTGSEKRPAILELSPGNMDPSGVFEDPIDGMEG
jgi:hypothetical protein